MNDTDLGLILFVAHGQDGHFDLSVPSWRLLKLVKKFYSKLINYN